MSLPESISTGLKEWQLLVDALGSGRQMLLLRKGGVSDRGGVFTLEHRQFVLFPTYIHQNLRMIKPDAQAGFESRNAEPSQVAISVAGEVTNIVQVQSRSQIDQLEAEHVWTSPLIDMRFSYKPENPLYLVLVRAYRLPRPTLVENTPAYAGCKSWVPLNSSVPASGATPVISDADYAKRRDGILSVF